MTRNAALLPCLLFAGMAPAVHAQQFKVGDYVDFRFGTSWMPCKVTRPLINNGYGIACGASDYTTVPQDLRPRAATAEDKRQEAETAAALPYLPRPGNGVGAKFGTREPKTCASRTAPAKGAPSPDQARQYVICDTEHVLGTGLFLVTNVKVQVAPASHSPTPSFVSMQADIDPSQPVWDIRGSLTQYQCTQTSPDQNAYARTHNCSVNDLPAATGYCYKNTFRDWHCVMGDPQNATLNTREHVLPPEGN
jgi:hypothetical protein